MKCSLTKYLLAAVLVAYAWSAAAQPIGGPPKPVQPVVIPADAMRWTVAAPPFPERSEMAVLSGDPYGESLFTIRVRILPGSTLAEHWHLRQQQITVIDGEADLTVGGEGPVQRLASGSFFLIPALKPHTIFCPVQTVLQITGFGPYDVQRGASAKASATLFIRSVSPAAGTELKPQDEIAVQVEYAIENFRPEMFDLTMQFDSTTPHRSIGCPKIVKTSSSTDAPPAPPRPSLAAAKGTATLTCSAAMMLGRSDISKPLRVRLFLVERTGEMTSHELVISDYVEYK